MAKNPRKKQAAPTKKHLARMERERLQSRYILIGSIIVLVLVLGLIGYGVLDQTYLQAIAPVAIVNGEKIPTNLYQAQVRYTRNQLIGNAVNTYQILQMFGSDPNYQSSFLSQLVQIQTQLTPETVGKQVLDQMINDALIRQEAKRRGITITQDEFNKAMENAFGYYPNGTPTPTATLVPIPTQTLNPTELAILGPSPTPTATPVITATATPTVTPTPSEVLTTTLSPSEVPNLTLTPAASPTITPTPEPTATPTPYTLEGYQKLYSDTVANLKKNLDFNETDLRYLIENQLYHEKVMEAVLSEMNISREEEEVWARHILVPDQATAEQVLSRLNAGESWDTLAAEFSTDTSNKNSGGDLGWFPKGQMVAAFEDAAFSLKVGEVSQPVQTQFGWHIIQVLGHEMRPLTDSQYQQLRQTKFQDWLTQQNDKSDIVRESYWVDRVPAIPTMPAEITDLINQAQQQQNQLNQPLPTTPPQPATQPAATPEPSLQPTP